MYQSIITRWCDRGTRAGAGGDGHHGGDGARDHLSYSSAVLSRLPPQVSLYELDPRSVMYLIFRGRLAP